MLFAWIWIWSKIWTKYMTTYITCKSLLEALILASTKPQYGKRLFIDLPVQYMKTTSSEQNCFFLTFKTIYVQMF